MEMEQAVWGLAFISFWLIINPCLGQPSFSLLASPSSVAVNSDSRDVFVAAGAQLLRLNGQFRLLENVTVSGELLRITLSPGGGRLVGCLGGSSRTCFVFNSSSLSNGAIATVSGAQYLTESGMAVIAVDHSFYLGSEGEGSAGSEIQLSQYQYTAGNIRTREYNVDVSGGFDRLFYGGFARNGYVYYFVADQAQTENGIRVLRVCDCGSGSCSSSSFEALYELTLRCSSGSSSTTEVCGVTLLETFADRDEPVVVVTQCEIGTRNRVCGYLLSEIDSRMNTLYTECRDNTISQLSLPWESFHISCSLFTPVDSCDFGSDSPAVYPDSELSGYYLVDFGRTTITAALAVRVEGVSLVYVAYSGAIAVFSIKQTGFFTQQDIMDAVATHPVSSPVRDLQWREGIEYITVTTDEMVFQLALDMCSQYSNCSECVGMNRYPLCGWCTVENKCSRRSQCQSSREERRWVVNSDECISITVIPEQFVLDRPTIVNVTASPSLPSGLTYNCSFSGSGNVFPIEVEAVEVVAGTEYACSIRGIITDLGTVLTVSSFSFVSVEMGILFATSEDALTIYDCDAASSCGGCVQTDNACGWCLYGNVCSGIPDPCPVPDGVSNSYLQLGGRSSYLEVCPILDPAPTNSGDYAQPVRVKRSLQLQTRNLPEPVGGFEYVCVLGGTTLPVTYTTTDGHVITFLENNVATASTVTLELVWKKGALEYSIEENSEDDIRCVLYDCPLLASGCSSCLALNAMGFQCGWCSADTSCAVVEECSNGDIATSTSQCPSPAITSVVPLSGPVEGGTHLTITGTNLGVAFSDIVEITLQGTSDVTCNVTEYESDYIPGTQVVCETEAFSSVGHYGVTVEVNCSGVPVLSSGVSFSVEHPTLSGVSSEFAPVSGGVEVMISGRHLDIGNTEDTRVELNRVECVAKEIMSDYIRCVSGSFANSSNLNTTRNGPVEVFIDNAIVSLSGMEFEYRDDPVYLSSFPQMIIPAGGITVTFEGKYLDVVDQPVFVFTDSRLTSSDQSGNCSVSSTTMACVIPSFMCDTQLPTNVSYTIQVGDAPGPDLTNEPLTLSVVPDPTFATDGSSIVGGCEHTIGSGALLVINGSFLDSVERSEISVTVGGEPCTERQAAEDDINTCVCSPPDQPPGGKKVAAVVVRIGAYLEFTVGNLMYIDSTQATQSENVIIGATVGGVVLAVLLTIVIVVTVNVALLLKYGKGAAKTRKNSDVLEVPLASLPSSGSEAGPVEMMKEELKKQLPPRLLIPNNCICLLGTIGQGEFGEVYKAQVIKRHSMGMPCIVAVKTLKGLFTLNDVQQIMKEVVKMQDFEHPRVMSLLGVCLDSGGVGIVMPYMANGSVLNYLKREKASLLLSEEAEPEEILPPRRLLLRMCLQIAEGMEYLAQQMFVHRDLAARNCMLDSKGNVKVGDFGLAEDMYSIGYVRNPSKTMKVPFKWMSPESLEEGLFSEQSDVWSYGVTCWEVFSVGKIPYPAVDPPTLLRMVKEGHRLEHPDNPACLPEMYAIMRKCWKMVPTDRPSFSAIVQTLGKILAAMAVYVELGMTLQTTEAEGQYEEAGPPSASAGAEIAVEPNPVYGLGSDGRLAMSNPVYGVSESDTRHEVDPATTISATALYDDIISKPSSMPRGYC